MTGRARKQERKTARERADEMMRDAYWDGYDDAREDVGTGEKRFRRNKIDGVLGGVCAGIGDYVGMDPILVRLIFLGLVLFTGFPLIIYFVLWFFVPSDKRAPYRREAREAVRAERRREAHHAKYADLKRRYPSTVSLTDVRSKFRSIETRMQDLEKSITSKEWQLRREFKDLED